MGTWYYSVTNTDGTVSREVTSNYTLANATGSRIYKGSSLPDITGGFGNYFRYKSFDLNIPFNFSYGAYMYDSQYAALMSGFSAAGSQQSVDVMNAWQKPGDITDVPINIMVQNNNNAQSTRFLYKNDYVRLKSLTLGYNVNSSLTKSLQRLINLEYFCKATTYGLGSLIMGLILSKVLLEQQIIDHII